MPVRYAIHTAPAPHRFKPVTRSGIIAWEEGCLKCAVCVKKQCVYGVYDHRGIDPRQMIDSIDNQCMNCLRCVQSCPNELIHKSINPEYQAMGDACWTPDIIASLWSQAETGKIPVSGAGYPGPFSGPGFDAMWTDMSEIVRPTRDGIHGREYISTAIDLGRTPGHLCFSDDGDLKGDAPLLVDIPLPIILKMPAFGAIGPGTVAGWAMAAKRLGTLFSLPWEMIDNTLTEFYPWLLPVVSAQHAPQGPLPDGVRVVEVHWSDGWQEVVDDLMTSDPSLLVSVSVPMAVGMEEMVLSIAEAGIPIIHLEATMSGRSHDENGTYMKEGIRSVHLKLVEESIRDGLTLLVSGGLSMAEHVTKSILCGADGVLIDFPILIALECRMCRRCTKGLSCPVDIGDASADWTASRVVNLTGAWHNQLLEMMGAMGMRDARRLRGEAGRAMFFEELDRETFSAMGVVEGACDIE
jgi:ferredoxin